MQKNPGLLLCCAALATLAIVSACTTQTTGTDPGNGFKEYRDVPMGISFEYPASWHMERAASAEYARTVQYTFIRPGGNFTAAFQSGDNAALKHSPATLEAWRDQYLEMLPNATYRTDYRLVASEPATLSGSPAWRIEYTALMKNGPRMRGEVFLMINGTRGAMIALVGNDDADGALSDGPQHFVRSIEIAG